MAKGLTADVLGMDSRTGRLKHQDDLDSGRSRPGRSVDIKVAGSNRPAVTSRVDQDFSGVELVAVFGKVATVNGVSIGVTVSSYGNGSDLAGAGYNIRDPQRPDDLLQHKLAVLPDIVTNRRPDVTADDLDEEGGDERQQYSGHRQDSDQFDQGKAGL